MPITTDRKWDLRHLGLCLREISKWSKDPSTKVGALIVRDGKLPVSWGYNGPARTVDDEHTFFLDRENKLMMAVHAELNAILNANTDLSGCTLYATHQPCSNCASTIVQKRIARVVWIMPEQEYAQRWSKSLELGEWQFNQAGIVTDTYHISEILG